MNIMVVKEKKDQLVKVMGGARNGDEQKHKN